MKKIIIFYLLWQDGSVVKSLVCVQMFFQSQVQSPVKLQISVFYHEVNMILEALFSNGQRVIVIKGMQPQLWQLDHHCCAQSGAEHGLLFFLQGALNCIGHWIMIIIIYYVYQTRVLLVNYLNINTYVLDTDSSYWVKNKWLYGHCHLFSKC